VPLNPAIKQPIYPTLEDVAALDGEAADAAMERNRAAFDAYDNASSFYIREESSYRQQRIDHEKSLREKEVLINGSLSFHSLYLVIAKERWEQYS